MDTIGRRVWRLRAQARLSRRALAHLAGKSERWLVYLEHDDPLRGRLDDLPTVCALADALGVSPGDLVPDGGDESVKRRAFLASALAVSGAALVPAGGPPDPEPWERLARVLERPSRIDAETLAHLERVTIALEALEYDLAPAALIGPVRGHLAELCHLLESPLPTRQRREMLSLAGEAAATAGWLMWDLERSTDAAAYFDTGQRAAEEAGDAALVAFIRASVSFRPSYRERPADRLRQLSGLGRIATPRTRAWIDATAAEAHALLGDEPGCLSALDRAAATMASMGDDRATRRPRHDPFDATRLLGERGATLVKLAAHERFRARGVEAARLLEHAVSSLEGQPRMLHSLRSAYACALARQGEVDGAVEAAGAALEGVASLGVQTTLRSLDKVVRDLSPWADEPAVHALTDRLREVRASALRRE